ncbi:hypothetical protein LSUE1_G000463 [Lachnellula suecica]|uniref:Uncharacterized protein n=1 Tax=Lachnellula suecica TaxID=602035 RepID=A0A8T9CF57_9HELO|nr:hypothetical protein LSUE1_G000463 [Lachnellula suecica]
MSTTSTAGTTASVQEIQGVLRDYTIHLTGDESTNNHGGIDPPNGDERPSHENPPDWPKNHYRVPNYRPLNRNLDLEDRPKGFNGIEFVFLTIMFSGVYLNSAAAKIWGRTGGPFFPGLFRYAIGGEW